MKRALPPADPTCRYATIPIMKKTLAILLLGACAAVVPAQKRLVLIDEDGSGPGGSGQMAMLALLQAPDVQVLGITIVTGDAWRDEETLHTWRMLELTGHAYVPVARGAVFPLVRTQEETQLASALDGKATWLGAWGAGTNMDTNIDTGTGTPPHFSSHGPYEIPPLPEGMPATKPIDEANYVRIVIAVDGEVKFETVRLSHPDRIVVDLQNSHLSSELVGKTFPVEDGFLRQIRVARFTPNVARIVLDVEKIDAYSIFSLPNPFRLVIDIQGAAPTQIARAVKPGTPADAEGQKAEKVPSPATVNPAPTAPAEAAAKAPPTAPASVKAIPEPSTPPGYEEEKRPPSTRLLRLRGARRDPAPPRSDARAQTRARRHAQVRARARPSAGR